MSPEPLRNVLNRLVMFLSWLGTRKEAEVSEAVARRERKKVSLAMRAVDIRKLVG
jgi:hypothetical protein